MKIKGDIEIIRVNDNKLIAKGENKFTNVGRQHLCNWLLHDNYSDDVAWNGMNPYQGGRSISDMKIVPYTQVNGYKIGTQTSYVQNPTYCLYPKNNDFDCAYLRNDSGNTSAWGSPYSGTYNDQYGALFYEFTTPKNLAGMMLWGYNNGNRWSYVCPIQIATSPNTFVENTNWTVQNVRGNMPNLGYSGPGNYIRNYQLHRFDYYDSPNRILTGVKTLRLRTKYINTWSDLYIYGIWFLEANDYPNTPSVIGLGTGTNTPAITDTTLQTESIRKFVRSHKTVADNQVKYSMRLNYDEGNGVTYNEVGLFVNPTAGGYIGLDHQASYCTNMFARGLFSSPWSKTTADLIDIDYTLTLTN